jgi:hypothetical protein
LQISEIFRLQSLTGPTLCRRPLPELCFWHPKLHFFWFLLNFLPIEKLIKIHQKSDPPKTSQNLKNPTPERQKLSFSLILDVILTSIFHEILKPPKPHKM